MAKYTIADDPLYILFNGIINTPTEGEAFAFRKHSVKELRAIVATDKIIFGHLDDTDSPFFYYDLIDPTTGHAFADLLTAKIVILSWLNEIAGVESQFLGVWDAGTNDPVLANGGYWGTPSVRAPAKSFFIVDGAGSTMVDGTNNWVVGDIVKTTGSQWIRIPESITVTAINVFLDDTSLPVDFAGITNVQAGIEHIAITAVKELKDLSDVDPLLAPADKQILRYNIITQTF